MSSGHPQAFTLIELLIVVAIIAILAAIAIPNFIEAQVRSKVSRIKADMRTVGMALELYRVDQNKYPVDFSSVYRSAEVNYVWPVSGADAFFVRWILIPITTPVAYMTTLPGTAFDTKGSKHSGGLSFTYDGQNHGVEYSTSDYLGTDPAVYSGFPYFCTPGSGWSRARKWRLRDVGPDLWANNQATPEEPYYGWVYDTSNGTVSSGDIVRWGP